MGSIGKFAIGEGGNATGGESVSATVGTNDYDEWRLDHMELPKRTKTESA